MTEQKTSPKTFEKRSACRIVMQPTALYHKRRRPNRRFYQVGWKKKA